MAFRAFAVVCNRRRDLVPVVFISPVSNRSPVEQFVPVPPVPRLLVTTGLLSLSTDPPLMASCQQLHTIRGLSCPLSLSIMFSGFPRTKGHLSLAEIVPQGHYVSRLQSSRSSRNRGTNLSLVRPGGTICGCSGHTPLMGPDSWAPTSIFRHHCSLALAVDDTMPLRALPSSAHGPCSSHNEPVPIA